MNTVKIKAIIYGNLENLRYVDGLDLSQNLVENEPIEFVKEVKNLGVIFLSDLSWNTHITSISSKVHGALYRLRQRVWLLNADLKTLLVQALVIPYIDYSCLVYNSMPEYLNLKDQRLFN